MIHDGALGADRRVVTDEECDLEGPVEAGTHRERLVGPADDLHPIVELVEQEVAHITVRVIDDEARGAGAARPRDGSIRFGGHQPAGALIFRHPTHHLVQVDDASHSLHVDGEKDPVTFRRLRLH